MKLKLDENLPLRIAASLRVLGYDIHTTDDEGLSSCNSLRIACETAKNPFKVS